MHHQGLLGITGNADTTDGLVFTNRHGRVLDPTGQIKVPQPRDMPDVEPYDGPTGERLRKESVWFQRRPHTPEPAAPPGERGTAA